MPIPELTKRSAEQQLAEFCERRVPQFARDQVYLEFKGRGNDLSLIERRVPWDDSEGEWTSRRIALFRWDPTTATWILKWANRHDKWLEYPDLPPVGDIAIAIKEVDDDPYCCFWG
jgi:hypothetical protein